MSRRKVSGVQCDRKLSAKVKGKMFKNIIRPTMFYGMETVAVTERQVGKMKIAELKMVRWAMGVTRKDKMFMKCFNLLKFTETSFSSGYEKRARQQ